MKEVYKLVFLSRKCHITALEELSLNQIDYDNGDENNN